MRRTGKSLNALKSGMKKYPQVLINIRTEIKFNLEGNDVIKKAVETVEKKLGDKGRVLLRASGTEPLIRVMVEGINEDEVLKYANQLANEVRNAIAP